MTEAPDNRCFTKTLEPPKRMEDVFITSVKPEGFVYKSRRDVQGIWFEAM